MAIPPSASVALHSSHFSEMSLRLGDWPDCWRAWPVPHRRQLTCSWSPTCGGWTSSLRRRGKPRSTDGGEAASHRPPSPSTCFATRKAWLVGCAAWTGCSWSRHRRSARVTTKSGWSLSQLPSRPRLPSPKQQSFASVFPETCRPHRWRTFLHVATRVWSPTCVSTPSRCREPQMKESAQPCSTLAESFPRR